MLTRPLEPDLSRVLAAPAMAELRAYCEAEGTDARKVLANLAVMAAEMKALIDAGEIEEVVRRDAAYPDQQLLDLFKAALTKHLDAGD
jgi:hypothetical protein